jgi:hypothetical protein
MSIVSRVFACAMGAAILLAGAPASATKYLVSFSGTMASGTDSGLFGAPGDLTGKSFVANYQFDSNASFHDTNPGVYDTIFPAPVSLTIAGSTYVFPTYGVMGSFANAYVGSLNFWFQSLIDANPLDAEGITNTAFSPWFQPNLDFGGNAIISAPGGGGYNIHVCCCPSCGPDFPEIKSSGQFLTDTVTITAVPEPATWGLMIAGFGLAGAALRRRRAVAA